MTLTSLAVLGLLVVTWACAYTCGQRSRRSPTNEQLVRDMVRGYRAMGHDRDAAQALVREQQAHLLRRTGMWDAK